VALHPNLKKSFGAGVGLLLLGFALHNSDNKGLSVLAWVGGGSILIGSYRVIVDGVDFLDQLADRLYWDKRK
jgi:hypothetical protein